jgi:hypothetical protein
MPKPLALAARTRFSISGDTFGLPRIFPCALARSSPALTRSRIIAHSNSAKTPHIWNSAFPAGVVVSMPCWCIEVDALAVNLIQKADEMLEASPEAVDPPGSNEIEFPARGSFKLSVESGSLLASIRAAHPMVDVFLCHLPAVALGDCSQLLKLVFGSLMISSNRCCAPAAE